MITEEELAETVFTNGLNGKKGRHDLFVNNRRVNKIYFTDSVKNFIFSWPNPCAFGLVVDAAEKLGWDWEFSDGWFWFKNARLIFGITNTGKTHKYEWRKDNPMWAVCLAFRDVLRIEGKLDENSK